MTTGSKLVPTNPRGWFSEGPLAALRGEMDDLFESFFGEKGTATAATLPSVDVAETDEAIEVTTDVPGYKADEVDIEIRDNYLTISGEHSEESESDEGNGKKYHRVERRQGSFSRSVRLPCEVKPEDVEAELSDGVLKVTMAKAEPARTHKVSIKPK